MIVTNSLCIFTIAISVLGFYNREIFDQFKFNAYDVRHSGQWYRIISYGFFHAGWVHLLVNMLVLYSFGAMVEKGYRFYFHEKYVMYYLLLYFTGLVVSIIPALIKHRNDVYYNSIGASGAISAVLFTSILLSPLQKVSLFFLPGIPAWIFGIFYLGYEAFMMKRAKDNIGHDAHFWGAIIGLVFTIALRPETIDGFFQMLKNG